MHPFLGQDNASLAVINDHVQMLLCVKCLLTLTRRGIAETGVLIHVICNPSVPLGLLVSEV